MTLCLYMFLFNFHPIFFLNTPYKETWSFDVSSRLASTFLSPSYIIPGLSQMLFFRFAFYSLIFAIAVGSLHVRAGHTLSCRNYFADLYPISVTRSSSASSVFWPSFTMLSLRPATIAQVFYKIYVCRRARNGYGWLRLFIFPVTVIFQTRTGRRINVPGCFWRAWKIRRQPRRHFSRSHPSVKERSWDDQDLTGLQSNYNRWSLL